ncbi:hypothetical protein QJS10_CPA08g01686 [Acorus calamus]|uniref:Methylenetetrahydrofolate reductase n=1 Tax=Acorus calamus TaxID=4465 RepID=A0AAV9E7N8_ACOCL|nr:hypothetical protein QJS10_CPA08g01686 [Acorus calamus]
MGTYGQLILALKEDHRAEEVHKISVFVQFWKLFRDIESYDRTATDKLIVQKVADAYELLGLPEDKKRILDKYDYLFNESSRLNFKISKTNSGKKRAKNTRLKMKVVEKIRAAEVEDMPLFSFEYFPPKTNEGVKNLFERMERMVSYGPSFCDVTWGAGGSTANLTLDIANRMQNMVCVETMMHLTCTNMPVEKIDHALDTIKANGIQNVLALRGDPPHGQDKFIQVAGGFACALDLVQHIRAKYGDYFGITVAGYPEAHPDMIQGEEGVSLEGLMLVQILSLPNSSMTPISSSSL